MRGKADPVAEQAAQYGITPAYAGKSDGRQRAGASIQDHPRVCGEKAPSSHFCTCSTGSPPRMRGKAISRAKIHTQEGITPAYAGKSCFFFYVAAIHGDHPRVCGEKNVIYWDTDSCKGSPPRMRGKGALNASGAERTGITPAYAGKSEELRLVLHDQRDHPRVCGEKWKLFPAPLTFAGSPPRMRGKVC